MIEFDEKIKDNQQNIRINQSKNVFEIFEKATSIEKQVISRDD
jgi:hypothetical protein